MDSSSPLITNDAVVLGLLVTILALIFRTSSSDHPFWRQFYTFVPSLLLCYFIPSLFNSLGWISGDESNLYFVASRYLLPASLVLLTLSIDLKSTLRLGPKAVIMFLAGTISIVLGGPIALFIVSVFQPDILGGAGPEELWRGLSTIAGSWIGGGANQTAMFEVFQPSTDLFSAMVTVDIIVANIWLGFLLYGAGISTRIDKIFKADNSAIDELKEKMTSFQQQSARTLTLPDLAMMIAIGFGLTGVSHLVADWIAPWIGSNAPILKQLSLDSTFFWIVVIATTGGLAFSFTKARNLEGAGASKVGSMLLYVLVATIGMKMNLFSILENPIYFLIGLLWILIHVGILLMVGKWIKAPFFFTAVGSQANVGGAASAPIVASAFHPSLAPVGVLMAVLGYALGTYGAWLSALLMQWVSVSGG
jgi:uncharacterized membrane protein